VHLIGLLAQANEEVVGLNVTVNEILGVHILYSIDHLVRKHQDCLQTKFAVAKAEQVLEGWAKQVDDHDIVVAFNPIPVDVRNTHTTSPDLVQLGHLQQLWVLGLDGLKLDGALLSALHIGSNVDITKRARADLAPKAKLATNAELHI
jgi:hypothetical protein